MGLVMAVGAAQAASERVKNACRSDYFKHCSMHAVGTPGLRQCMRQVGERLSNPCLIALFEAGEISKADIEQNQKSSATKTPVQQAGNAANAKDKKKALKPKSKNKIARKLKPSKTAKGATASKAKNKPKVAGWSNAPKKNQVIKPKGSPSLIAPAAINAPPTYSHIQCRGVTLTGQPITFRCGLDQKCCYTDFFDQRYCVPKSSSCY